MPRKQPGGLRFVSEASYNRKVQSLTKSIDRLEEKISSLTKEVRRLQKSEFFITLPTGQIVQLKIRDMEPISPKLL